MIITGAICKKSCTIFYMAFLYTGKKSGILGNATKCIKFMNEFNVKPTLWISDFIANVLLTITD